LRIEKTPPLSKKERKSGRFIEMLLFLLTQIKRNHQNDNNNVISTCIKGDKDETK